MTLESFITALLLIQLSLFNLGDKDSRKLLIYDRIVQSLGQQMSIESAQKIVLDKRVQIKPQLILINLDQPDQSHYITYSLQKRALYKGLRFLRRYHKTFDRVEKESEVDKETILAILYIETNFNPRKAKYNVLNAYVSLAYADHPHYLNQNLRKIENKYQNLPADEISEKKETLIKRSKWKSKWALKQISALVELSKRMRRPLLNIKGSFAGAIGYPQFIPTSYITYAVDGNKDNLIDLYNIHDSIASIGNYLKTEGYKKGDVESQKKAIFHYNHSTDYVNFVLEYSKKIKVLLKKKPKTKYRKYNKTKRYKKRKR